MKKIIIAGENIAILNSDRVKIKFGSSGEGHIPEKIYDADHLSKTEIREIRKNPLKAKDYLKDLKEIEIASVDKSIKNS